MLEDHHLTAERALDALGAEPPTCLEILETWRTAVSSSLAFEWLDPTGGAGDGFEDLLDDQRRADREDPPPPARGRASLAGAERRVGAMRRLDRLRLAAALPDELRRRLAVAAVVGAWRRLHHGVLLPDDQAALSTALVQRIRDSVVASVRAWRRLPPTARVDVVVAGFDRVEQPRIEGRVSAMGVEAKVWIRPDWLVDVWAAGFSVVDGCFLLERLGARRPESGGEPIIAARWARLDPGASVAVTGRAHLYRVDDEAHLTWLDPV